MMPIVLATGTTFSRPFCSARGLDDRRTESLVRKKESSDVAPLIPSALSRGIEAASSATARAIAGPPRYVPTNPTFC
jgi:hypothetical protein